MSDGLFSVEAKELSAVTDGELVARAQAGDTCAFEELVRRHRDRIYGLARYLCNGHAANAEDTFQNALMKAYLHLHAFRAQAQFSTWLTRITVNECLLHLRRQRRERNYVHLDDGPGEEERLVELATVSGDPEEECARQEFLTILQRCLATLPDSHSTAFVLRHLEGLSNQEIAERLGLSVPATKSRVLRTRLQLQRCLTKDLGHGGKQCYWPRQTSPLAQELDGTRTERSCK